MTKNRSIVFGLIVLGGSVAIIVVAVLLFQSCFFGTCHESTFVWRCEGPVEQEWIAHYQIKQAGLFVAGLQSIAVDENGDICVTGEAGTVKYNSAGEEIWASSEGGICAGGMEHAMTDGGYVYVTDNTGNTYTLGGGSQWMIVKSDSTGAVVWRAFYSDGHVHSGDYRPTDIAIDASGNVYVTGESIYKECMDAEINFDRSNYYYVEYTTIKYSQLSGQPLSTPHPTTYTLTILPWKCCEPYLMRGESCPCTNYYTCCYEPGGAITPDGGTYQAGTYVTITAQPAYQKVFDGWSGDAYNKSPTITICMNSDKLLYVHFIDE